MADNLPPVWERAAHTSAKHEILQAYLKAWIPIMSQQSYHMGAVGSELLFVDGFAGPGCYSRGEDGSPLLAVKSVLSHSLPLPVPMAFLFIEENLERYRILQGNIQEYADEIRNSSRIGSVDVERGDCETCVSALLDKREQENRRVGPALFFLDQFGYCDVSMNLIRRIMSNSLCEVFSYLNWDHMHRFLADQSKWGSLRKTFGGDEWKPVLGLELKERAAFMLQTYRKALSTKARSKYVWQFTMSDGTDNPLYWLFFCTNSLRGLAEMKRAMWGVDPSGGFRFSDRDNPSQIHLFNEYTEQSLTDDLIRNFTGRIVTVREIEAFVLSETPAYKFKNSLRAMEDGGRIRPIDPAPGRRRGTFPEKNMGMRVEFFGKSVS
jgi:three-Cys-motif partner protein